MSDIRFEIYVIDLANILNETELASLNSTLKDLENKTTCQIFVAIINSLEGQKLEKLSFEIVNRYKFGQAIKNNGILFLISKNDRKIRIEVGYGLENIITDQYAGQIIRNEMAPKFKTGNFYEGISTAVNSIIGKLSQPDIKHYFKMKWDIENFEAFLLKYPDSVQRCDALLFLGRFYEDVWNDSVLKFSKESERNKSIEYYHTYLNECPSGIWKGRAEYELSQVENKKPDFEKYLIKE